MTMSTGCSDFLETVPATSVSDQSVFNSVAGAQAALNGCYFQMRAYSGGGANRQDDWGIPSILMVSDVSADDIIVWGGWYCYTYNYWGETRGVEDIAQTIHAHPTVSESIMEAAESYMGGCIHSL